MVFLLSNNCSEVMFKLYAVRRRLFAQDFIVERQVRVDVLLTIGLHFF